MSTSAAVADRIEIADLFSRFARLLDEARHEDADTVFTDDVAVRSPRGGEMRGIGTIADFLRRSPVEGEHTQHTTTDLLADVDGDRASVSANSLVHYYRDGRAPHQTTGMRIAGTVARTPEGWRFSEVEIMLAWLRRD
ncbi:nuclear transport factor 2 family protein [Actinomadura sp. NPDC048032]|uniref:nuclear transport factor 2 family protein n=1 Tax=Actinomadura sp. NPDC048032 TaxID=3155747 RepID=UPI0034102FEC